MNPTESYSKYRLWISMPSILKEGSYYWTPVGMEEHTKEKAKGWLAAEFTVYVKMPTVEYKIVKETFWKPTTEIVEQDIRKTT